MSDRSPNVAFNNRAVNVVFASMLWLAASNAFGQAPQSTDVRELPANQTLEREMAGG